jgi:hypothetical protein
VILEESKNTVLSRDRRLLRNMKIFMSVKCLGEKNYNNLKQTFWVV